MRSNEQFPGFTRAVSEAIRERFGLSNSQIRRFASGCKNLIWTITVDETDELWGFGFGDLSDDDVIRISDQLGPIETFVGWNEHHGGPFHQTDLPMIIITRTDLKFRMDIIKDEAENGGPMLKNGR